MARKTILLIGPTGVGKSFIGNALLQLRTDDSSKFISSADTKSVTAEIKSLQRMVNLSSGGEQFQLTVIDTPGIMDTEGKSIEYVDKIIEYIRSHTINMIVIVHAKGRMTPAYTKYLRALKECLRDFSDATTALIINKMPRQGTLDRDGGNGCRTIVDCEKQEKDVVFSALKDTKLVNAVTIQNDPEDDELLQLANKFYSIALNSGEVDKTRLETWTQRLKYYQDVANGKVSADDAVKHRQQLLQLRINQHEEDIQWHRNRIHDLSISIASTSWVPIFGQISAAGMSIAIADSQHKLGDLIPALDRLQSEMKQLNSERLNTEREVKLAQAELTNMKSIFK